MNSPGNERNPQARQMADESMVRTLAAQATAIWPQERPLLDRYGLGPGRRVLDAGCGTGEFAARVAEAFPTVHVTGVDLIEASLETARQRHPDLGRAWPSSRAMPSTCAFPMAPSTSSPAAM